MSKTDTLSRKIHQNYIPELDGLRGIAILLVISYHYFSAYFFIFSFGWTGVDLFFVLSGYLITSRLVSGLNRKNYFSRFYKNRALRILPIYYSVLIGFYFIINTFVVDQNMGGFNFYNQHVLAFFLFWENWTFMKDVIYNIHLAHFWSLAVEEQFYLLWPMVIYFFYRKKYFIHTLVTTIFIIIIFRSNIYFNYADSYLDYYNNSFCRMDSFIIGGLLFFLPTDVLRRGFKLLFPASIVALFGGFIFLDMSVWGTFMGTVGFTVIAIFYAGLLFHTLQKGNRLLTIFLNQKWLIFLGQISYGLYIFHWMVLQFMEGRMVQFIGLNFHINEAVATVIALFLCLVLSLIVSSISFFYFESYFLRLKYKQNEFVLRKKLMT